VEWPKRPALFPNRPGKARPRLPPLRGRYEAPRSSPPIQGVARIALSYSRPSRPKPVEPGKPLHRLVGCRSDRAGRAGITVG
jgi:hypothetical protein